MRPSEYPKGLDRMLTKKLGTPLNIRRFDLLNLDDSEAHRLRTGLAECARLGLRTFRDLFKHECPPLEVLRFSKDLFKKQCPKIRDGENLTPEYYVAYVGYLLAIVTAKLSHAAEITAERAYAIKGLKRLRFADWVNSDLRSLLDAGLLRFDPHVTDVKLMAGIKRDSDSSWRKFNDIYWNWLKHMAMCKGIKEPDAEDIAQQVIVAIAKQQRGDFEYDPSGSFRGWLSWLLDKRVKDFLEKHRRMPMVEPVADPSSSGRTSLINSLPAPDNRVSCAEGSREIGELVEQALAKLEAEVRPHDYKMFYQRVMKGVGINEIAAEFGKTNNAVSTAIARTRRQFRDILKALMKR